MNKFKLATDMKPKGSQPDAIKKLVKGLNRGEQHQTLLGVTGSGKTFTMANVIEQVQKPTLVLAVLLLKLGAWNFDQIVKC